MADKDESFSTHYTIKSFLRLAGRQHSLHSLLHPFTLKLAHFCSKGKPAESFKHSLSKKKKKKFPSEAQQLSLNRSQRFHAATQKLGLRWVGMQVVFGGSAGGLPVVQFVFLFICSHFQTWFHQFHAAQLKEQLGL